jgi:ABC-type taurine transport system substrate-binding protein
VANGENSALLNEALKQTTIQKVHSLLVSLQQKVKNTDALVVREGSSLNRENQMNLR